MAASRACGLQQHRFESGRACAQSAGQVASGGMMVRVGSEQHLISDHPQQQHLGRTPSDTSYPGQSGSPSHRPYSPSPGSMLRWAPLHKKDSRWQPAVMAIQQKRWKASDDSSETHSYLLTLDFFLKVARSELDTPAVVLLRAMLLWKGVSCAVPVCSPLIGGLNGSLGLRSHSGLSVGEAGTPRARSGLPPHPPSPAASPSHRSRAQLPAHSAPYQQPPSDMQACTPPLVLHHQRILCPAELGPE